MEVNGPWLSLGAESNLSHLIERKCCSKIRCFYLPPVFGCKNLDRHSNLIRSQLIHLQWKIYIQVIYKNSNRNLMISKREDEVIKDQRCLRKRGVIKNSVCQTVGAIATINYNYIAQLFQWRIIEKSYKSIKFEWFKSIVNEAVA